MTPTEKGKRADALNQGPDTRRVLCEMVANREADLEDARAESEHMRLKALAVAGELQEENERLKAENAKLRELVRSMYDVLDVTIDWSELDDDMRDLGVEVDA